MSTPSRGCVAVHYSISGCAAKPYRFAYLTHKLRPDLGFSSDARYNTSLQASDTFKTMVPE